MNAATADKPKAISLGRILKQLFLFFVSLFVLLVITLTASAIYLNHWLKTGDVKSVVERAISKATGGAASFEKLKIDPAGKLLGKSFKLTMPDGSQVDIGSFDVEATFKKILKGKLTLNHLYIDKPHVSLVVKKKKQKPAVEWGLFGKKKTKVADKESLFSRFAILFAVEVKSAKIEGMSVDYREDDLQFSITGLKLISKVYIGRERTETQALFTTTRNSELSFAHGKVTAKIDPDIRFRATMNEATGKWTLLGGVDLFFEKVTGPYKVEQGHAVMDISADGFFLGPVSGKATVDASFYDEPALDVVGEWKETEAGVSYDVNVDLLRLDLTRLSRLYGASGTKVAGVLDVSSITASGVVGKEQADTEHTISAKGEIDLTGLVAQSIVAPKGVKANFLLDKIALLAGKYSGVFKGSLSTPELSGYGISVKKAQLNGEADLSGVVTSASGPSSTGSVKLALNAANFSHKYFNLKKIDIGGLASGEFASGDLEEIKIDVAAEDSVGFKAEGSMTGYGKNSIALQVGVNTDVGPWKRLLAAQGVPFVFSKGAAMADIKINGEMGEEWKRPRLDFNVDAKLNSVAGTYKKLNAKLLATDADIKTSGRINQLMQVTDLDSKVNIESGGFKFPKVVSSGSFTLGATVVSPDPLHDKVVASLQFSSKKLTLAKKGGRRSFPANLVMEGETDPVTGRHVLRVGSLGLGKSGSIKSEGWVDTEQEKLKIDLQALSLDLKLMHTLGLMKWPALSEKFSMGGKMSLTASADGALPASFEKLNYPLPFNLSVDANLNKGAITLKKQNIKSEGIDLDLQVDVSKSNIHASGSVKAAKFIDKKLFGGIELDPTFEFDANLVNGERLNISQLVLDATALGFVSATEGVVTGFNVSSMIDSGVKPLELFPNLTFEFTNYTSIELDKRQRFLTDLDIEGDVTIDVTAKATAKRSLNVDGTSVFRNLSMRKGKKRIVDKFDGEFPFTKTLAYGPEDKSKKKSVAMEKPSKKSVSVRETSFFEDLRKAGSERSGFTVSRAEAGPVTLRDTMFDVYFKESRLGVDYFKTSLLGGGLTGSFHIKREDDSYILRTTENFAGLDLRQMIDKELGLTQNEAQIDGAMNMEISFRADEKVETIDVAGIDVSLNLSRIGSKALDKLLLFIDPKESSPAVANARTIIKIANPTRVTLLARHGQLSLTMDLKYSPVLGGATVTMPVIKRAPIHSLANIEAIRKPLQKLSALKTVMSLVGSTRIIFEKDGTVTLR